MFTPSQGQFMRDSHNSLYEQVAPSVWRKAKELQVYSVIRQSDPSVAPTAGEIPAPFDGMQVLITNENDLAIALHYRDAGVWKQASISGSGFASPCPGNEFLPYMYTPTNIYWQMTPGTSPNISSFNAYSGTEISNLTNGNKSTTAVNFLQDNGVDSFGWIIVDLLAPYVISTFTLYPGAGGFGYDLSPDYSLNKIFGSNDGINWTSIENGQLYFTSMTKPESWTFAYPPTTCASYRYYARCMNHGTGTREMWNISELVIS